MSGFGITFRWAARNGPNTKFNRELYWLLRGGVYSLLRTIPAPAAPSNSVKNGY